MHAWISGFSWKICHTALICRGLAEMRGPSTGPELAPAHTQSVHHLAPSRETLLLCSRWKRGDPENIEGVKAGSNVLPPQVGIRWYTSEITQKSQVNASRLPPISTLKSLIFTSFTFLEKKTCLIKPIYLLHTELQGLTKSDFCCLIRDYHGNHLAKLRD